MRTQTTAALLVLLLSAPAARPATITEKDSTQPRGATVQPAPPGSPKLDPVIDGFRAPQARAEEQPDEYADWVGSMLANATRDPAFYATLSVANRDFVELVNAMPGARDDPSSPLGSFLQRLQLAEDISRAPDGRLRPEDLLPITADLCLRCHTPVGWFEGHSEPATRASPHLKGQFWGTAFLHHPVDAAGAPRPADPSRESEAELEGIDCDFCHRVVDTAQRVSRHDGSTLSNGNGGVFVDRHSPFCQDQDDTGRCVEESVEPEYDLLAESRFCGACHDVTNPLLQTQTRIGDRIPDMSHPIERTYTEWYWSGYRGEKSCQDCHEPMTFEGAHTWMIDPGLGLVWGDPDAVWRGAPYGYEVPNRSKSLRAAARRNRAYLKAEAAEIAFVDAPAPVQPGQELNVKVKVTNKTGHKLPTGFAEGRQIWIHVRAVDGTGAVLFEDGKLSDGRLVRTPETKVYEQVVLARGHPFLDANGDGSVDEKEGHFHFLLMNDIQKDNRIPPKGYDKAAYTADGAFILPHDPKDTDYADGQNWDVTPYRFAIPETATGPIRVEATLRYQTFSREYVEFLRDHDHEATQECGGRARSLPASGSYAGDCQRYDTWGKVLYDVWEKSGKGPAVDLGTATLEVALAE